MAVNKILLFLFTALLFSCGNEQPQQQEDVALIPNPKDEGGGYVSDRDQILSQLVKEEITAQVSSLDQEGKAQVAVVLVNSIGEQVPKDFAVALFNYWHIGLRDQDNGLLILLVKDQHRVEFETGYGLEDQLPDITCFQIQQEYMVPYFKEGDFDKGMLRGVNALANQLHERDSPETDLRPMHTAPSTSLIEDYNIRWEENIYTITTREKISFLKAWHVLRKENPFLNLAETPDTSRSTIDETPDGFKYTIDIPYDFSSENALDVLLNSFGFLVFNTIVASIVVFVPVSNHRRKYNPNENRRLLFSNKLYFNKPLTFFFLIGLPVVLLEFYLLIFAQIDAPPFASFAAGYIGWALYAHLHFMFLLPLNARRFTERHGKHEALAEANRSIRTLTFMFPLPFLWIFYPRHRAQLDKLRNRPYLCDCGTQMQKLNEVQDNEFISAGDLKEEELMAIDYDVWVCHTCKRHRTLQYENFKSSVIHCTACSKKTVRLGNRQIVKEATTSSDGYGYKHYDCANCGQHSEIKFILPKHLSSKGSSSSSRSGSSSSDNWGGGSSGGGGAGSSW
jgi:uncharacterized protein